MPLANLIKYRIISILLLIPLLALSGRLAAKTAADDAFVEGKIRKVVYPDWFNTDEFKDLEAMLEEANDKDKKGLMVFYSTQGCSYCAHFIKTSLGDPAIRKRVQDHFNVIGLEIFDDTELTGPTGNPMPVSTFAKEQQVAFAPTLLFFDQAGKRSLKIAGYQSPERFNMMLDYLIDGHYQKTSLLDFSRKQSAASPATETAALPEDPLFEKPPYALDRSHFAANQPLMILFEEPDCPGCLEFHKQVLALDEIRKKLKSFDIVRLNVQDQKTPLITPDGKKTTAAEWFGQSGLSQTPALAIFDEKGQKIVQTDATIRKNRMANILSLVTERNYEKGWTYQRQARHNAIQRQQKKAAAEAKSNAAATAKE